MVKKCAKLTNCDGTDGRPAVYNPNSPDDTVVYNAKSCKGDEKFSYNGSWKTLGYDHCQTNHLLYVDYDPTLCSTGNFCEADGIKLATDTQCPLGSCMIW
ncbi:hypothetical protein [Wolbachia endosymbiont of Folsomia candida]|uniref:hypothetical protein n=1 Tax=Wolbachia endosymbiont of Folsomia candida TaxID=169402 RepID=UPI000B29EBA3|nr:hypothetical protein [Wolbachia endosymbiont of Folsomia candida]APR98538.1 hypothetical protein ASM33_04750 [Wolbachia endosymbiont of Folsomia candida]